jgi:tetratricopeptide (TPR) repeat protein
VGCLVAAALASGWTAHAAEPDRAGREGCLSGPPEVAVAACRRVLEQSPTDVDARLAMGDALTRLGRYQDAVNELRQGLEASPGDGRIQRKLRIVESYLQEQKQIDARTPSAAPGPTAKPEVTLQLERVRCTSLTGERALKACEKALQLAPDDASLHRAKADALLAAEQLGPAIAAYRESLRLDAMHPAAAQGLERAQLQLKKHLGDCRLTSGESALKACDRANVAGGPDAGAIQVRRGELLLELGRPAQAEQAFEAALKHEPANAQAAAKLAALRKPKEPVSVVAAASSPEQGSIAPAAPTQARPQLPQPPPKVDAPRRYSNVPRVAGVTH